MYANAITEVMSLPMHQPLGVAGKGLVPDAPVTEQLPFTVRVVQDETDLIKAVQIRHAAYARHIDPKVADALRQPEALDTAPGAVILIAESKLDGSPMGSMRIQTNRYQPLKLEQSIELPSWMQGKKLAEATRLGVTQDKVGRLVKTVLFKAYYLYCLINRIQFMVITARSPVDRQYDRLLFQDVYPGMGYVPLEHVFGLPHRIMYLDVMGAQELWGEQGHPLLDFMCSTYHEDIRLTV